MSDKNYFAIIPAAVRYDGSLSANAKLLYGEITALCNEKGYCWAMNDYFAGLYGVTKKSIGSWIAQLEKRGYIEREIIYAEGTKEIQKRIIRLKEMIPRKEKVSDEKETAVEHEGQAFKEEMADSRGENAPLTYGSIVGDPMEEVVSYQQKGLETIEEKVQSPVEEKVRVNNTDVLNKTMNKTKEQKESKEKSGLHGIINDYTHEENLRQCLRDFIKMRVAKKKPVTDRALRMLLQQLDDLANTDEEKIKVLEQSIINCWQSVYPLKEEKGGIGYGEKRTSNDPYDPFDI